MTQRWWAPAAPRIGPDEFDLSLLDASGSPIFDLGAALLAYHRVGAAACEHVAKGLPSETVLVDALARSREQFAIPMVGCVSKSIGEGPYAGLLVRDVADDAERCALDLYRTAVSRGVAPSLAVQRVGLVYGVPAEALGTYRTLAATPAANPVALQNEADKVLMEWVEKTCLEEVDEREAVSKATQFKEADVVRDQLGRFAPEGEGKLKINRRGKLRLNRRPAGPVIGTEAEVKRELKSRVNRKQKAKAETRAERKERQVVERQEAQAAKPGERTLATRRVAARQAVKQALTQRRLAQREAVMNEVPAEPPKRKPLPEPTLGPVQYQTVDETLTFTLAPYQLRMLQEQVKSGAVPMISGRDLMQVAGRPSQLESMQDNKDLQNMLDEAQEQAGMFETNPFGPAFSVIDRADLLNPLKVMEAKSRAALDYLVNNDEYQRSSEYQREDMFELELKNVERYNHFSDPEKVVFLHRPEDYAPPPEIFQIHIEGGVRAVVEDNLKHPQYLMDQDQMFEADLSDRLGKEQTSWFLPPAGARERGSILTVISIKPIEDVEKADVVFREADVKRDAAGRFAPEGKLRLNRRPKGKINRKQRSQGAAQRQERRERQVLERPAGMLVPTKLAERKAERAKKSTLAEREAIEAALSLPTTPRDTPEPGPQLGSSPRLLPFTDSGFLETLGEELYEMEQGDVLPIGPIRGLVDMATDGKGADEYLTTQVVQGMVDTPAGVHKERFQFEEPHKVDFTDPKSIIGMRQKMERVIRQDPSISQVRVYQVDPEWASYDNEVEVEILRNFEQEPMAIVEFDDGVDADDPDLVIERGERYDLIDLDRPYKKNRSDSARTLFGGFTGFTITNAQVDTYKIKKGRP